MCEIFGISSKEKYVINDYLRQFFNDSVEHPQGWGLAVMEDGFSNIEKEPIQATKSHYLHERLTQDIAVKSAFAHIRLATIGNVEYKNCHPYVKKDRDGKIWTLVHNGSIFDYDELNPYLTLQEGDTDSERILLYIVDKINKAAHNQNANGRDDQNKLGRSQNSDIKESDWEKFELIDSIISDMSKDNKLNLLFTDGEYTYVHTNYPDSLYFLGKDSTVFFSTSPLSKEEWKPVPMTALLVYKDGSRVYEGQSHGNIYVENEENLKYLFQFVEV